MKNSEENEVIQALTAPENMFEAFYIENLLSGQKKTRKWSRGELIIPGVLADPAFTEMLSPP